MDCAIDRVGAILMDLKEIRKLIMHEPAENLDERMKASQVMREPIRYGVAIERVQYEFDCGSNRAKEMFKEWCYKGWIVKIGKKRNPQSFYQWNDNSVKKEDPQSTHQDLDFLL